MPCRFLEFWLGSFGNSKSCQLGESDAGESLPVLARLLFPSTTEPGNLAAVRACASADLLTEDQLFSLHFHSIRTVRDPASPA